MKELVALFNMLKVFGYTEEQLSELSVDDGITLIRKIRYEVSLIEVAVLEVAVIEEEK